MKILLLFPPITVNKASIKKCNIPMGLAYIAAVLEQAGHEVHVIDISCEGYGIEKEQGTKITFGLPDEEIKKRVKDIGPELVGIGCSFSSQFHNAIHVSKLMKEVMDVPVIVGGVHATFDAEQVLKEIKEIDYIVMGEGERTITELANGKPIENINGLAYRKKGRVVINEKRGLIANLDDLPFPARHLFNMEKYFRINKPFNHFPKKERVASIITSRGCYGKCTFCSSAKFWGGCARYRSVDSVMEEMKMLIDKYKVQEIQIEDDNMTGWPERAKELFRRMKELNIVWCAPNGVRMDTLDKEMLELMKKSRCYRTTFAIESANEDLLHDVIKKPYDLSKVKPLVELTKKIGIGLHTYWIIGLPGETKEQMWKTYNFAKSLKSESASFCLATPMIGTELLETCKDNNLLRDGFDLMKAHYREANIKNPNIPKEEIERLCDLFNNKINKGLLWRNPVAFFKKYSKSMIANPKGIKNMFKKFS